MQPESTDLTLYRSMPAHDLCVRCKADASSGCLRCASPLCDQHAPATGEHCAVCESDYKRTRSKTEERALNIASGVLIATAVGATAAGLFGWTMWWSMWLLANLGAVFLGLVAWATVSIGRKLFLSERQRPTARLADAPAPPASPSTKDHHATTR